MTDAMIETKQLCKRYKSETRNALNQVSLTVNCGDFFGLLGPNGSGKTTFISTLCGLIKASSGSAFISGYDVANDINHIKSIIGLVPQKIALYPTLNLKENLILFGRLYGLSGLALQSEIDRCLTIVELEKETHKIVGAFSGGMMRRANLAIGLLHQPKILFLDEPTANVDAHARNMIFESLREINKQGVTIVYTTHYLEEIETLCSKVAILNQGNIAVCDTLSNIKQQHADKANLSEIYLSLTSEVADG